MWEQKNNKELRVKTVMLKKGSIRDQLLNNVSPKSCNKIGRANEENHHEVQVIDTNWNGRLLKVVCNQQREFLSDIKEKCCTSIVIDTLLQHDAKKIHHLQSLIKAHKLSIEAILTKEDEDLNEFLYTHPTLDLILTKLLAVLTTKMDTKVEMTLHDNTIKCNNTKMEMLALHVRRQMQITRRMKHVKSPREYKLKIRNLEQLLHLTYPTFCNAAAAIYRETSIFVLNFDEPKLALHRTKTVTSKKESLLCTATNDCRSLRTSENDELQTWTAFTQLISTMISWTLQSSAASISTAIETPSSISTSSALSNSIIQSCSSSSSSRQTNGNNNDSRLLMPTMRRCRPSVVEDLNEKYKTAWGIPRACKLLGGGDTQNVTGGAQTSNNSASGAAAENAVSGINAGGSAPPPPSSGWPSSGGGSMSLGGAWNNAGANSTNNAASLGSTNAPQNAAGELVLPNDLGKHA